MQLTHAFAAICVMAAIFTLSPVALQAQFDQNKYYRLTTQWQGEGKSLDVINDGKNNQLQLDKTGNYSGQAWKFTPLEGGYYRLTTQWQGPGKSLDVVNDGKNNKLILAKTGNYSGQAWKITSLGGGYYRLTCQWQGPGKSLDVINDGKNNRLQLAKTGNYSGQSWKITEYNPRSASSTSSTGSTSGSTRSTLTAGQTMKKGSQITCPNKNYNLSFQTDGNLVLYGPGKKYMWDSKTNGKGATCTLQSDGNLVIYDRANKPVWSTETMAYFDRKYASRDWKPVKLEITNSGQCCLKSATNRVVWSCGKGSRSQSTNYSSIGSSLSAGQTLKKGTNSPAPIKVIT